MMATMMMKQIKMVLLGIIMTMLGICLLTACSSANEFEGVGESNELYAIIKPEGAQLMEITPDDYVLTLDNIIAVNQETGEFKMKNTERIDSKAFPIPTQYLILFYSKGHFLFEAKLNSVISSTLSIGLTFCHYISDKNGLTRYDLVCNPVVNQSGELEGAPDLQQQQGLKQMYQILKKAGKISSQIDYDFIF